MENSTLIIVVLIVLLVGFLFKKLIDSEERKNDPNLDDPRDSNTKLGNQGVKTTKNSKVQ